MNESNATTRPAQISEAEARAAFEGVRCAACDGIKRRRRAFCPTCYYALTWQARADLAKVPGEDGFLENFWRHLRHLQLNPVRRRRFAVDDKLPYRSISEFEAAGWKFTGYGMCQAPRCSQSVLWFRTPNGKRACLDENLQFHRNICADAGYFERRRAAQMSAKSKKRAS